MNQPEQQDPMDALLREQNPYINDDGFTGRVIAALPRRRRAWLRPTLLLGTAAIGWVLAVRWLPWRDLPPLDLSAVLSLNSQALMPWMVVLAVAASLVWAVATAIEWED